MHAPAIDPAALPDRNLDVLSGAQVRQSRAQAKLEYRPEIDGLRAFAVVPVVLFHLGVAGFRGGNLGVDVFFVISGFLITSIVKREADAGVFSFKKFWARRVRRIMPAMLAVTTASLLFTFFEIYRPDQPAIGRQAAWALLSGANVYFWQFVGNYWGLAASQSPFLHMWSLAVEEQFYLFVPPAIWLIYRFAPRHLLTCVITVLALSLAAFLYEAPRHPEATFYLLPTRAWELAAGCALAVVGNRKACPGRETTHGLLGALGLATVVASYFFIASSTVSAGMIFPVLGSVLVIAFARSGPAYALLANRATVYVGKLSYSLYLWHWPVIVFPLFMERHPPIWASVAVMTALTLASYYLVEGPTRHAKRVVPYALAGLGVMTVAAACIGLFPRAYDTHGFETPQLYIRAYDCNPTAPPLDDTWAGTNVLPTTLGKTAFVDGGLRTGSGDPQVVVFGDSHATFWSPVVRIATDQMNVPAAFWVMSGVDPFFTVPATRRPAPWYIAQDHVLQYDEARIRLLATWKPKVVVVAARWSVKSAKQVQPFIDYVSQHAGEVLLIEQPPELPIGNRNSMQYLSYQGYVPEPGKKQFYETANRDDVKRGRTLLRTLAATHPNVRVIETHDLYEKADTACVIDGRQIVYMDDDHLTFYGASLAQDRINRAVGDALVQGGTDAGGAAQPPIVPSP